MRINLSGRAFSHIEGKSAPPSRGDYVAYNGSYYPVSARTGYPISIVADIAAKVPNKVVLVPGESIVAFLSGTGRVVETASKPDETGLQERNEFARSLMRLTLLSNHKEVIALGDIPLLGETPCERVDVSSLDLPPVIKRSRTWGMFALFLLVVISSLAAGALITARAQSAAEQAQKELAALDAEMSLALDAVKEGRAKLAASGPAAQVAKGTDVMPAQSDSFLSIFFAGSPLANNQIRVTDGKFHF